MITREDRERMKTTIRRLVGLEIMDEDSKSMTLQFLPEPSTLDPEKIVEAVEKSAGRSWDSVRVEWVPDATHLAFYKQLADANGITLEHELKTLLDFAYSQGWFGMAAPDPFKILLTPEQFRTLQEMFGKDIPTGADVMEKIQQAFALAPLPAAAPADDFGLGAL